MTPRSRRDVPFGTPIKAVSTRNGGGCHSKTRRLGKHGIELFEKSHSLKGTTGCFGWFKAAVRERTVFFSTQRGIFQGLRYAGGFGLLAVGLAGMPAHAESNGPEQASSIWNSVVPGTNVTYAEMTSGDSIATEEEIPMLPLPVPALAAGAGLGLALVVRARWRR